MATTHISIVILQKSGKVKGDTVPGTSLAELAKKAGYKNTKNFELIHSWSIQKQTIELYGKTEGASGSENKYELPPPVDSDLFFGNLIVVKKGGSLTSTEWETIYNQLYGGFEDIEDTDDETDTGDEPGLSPEEDDISSDDEDSEEETEDDEEEEKEEEDEPITPRKPIPTRRTPTTRKRADKKKAPAQSIVAMTEEDYFHLGTELEEEPYK